MVVSGVCCPSRLQFSPIFFFCFLFYFVWRMADIFIFPVPSCCKHRQTNKWVNEWLNEWMNVRTTQQLCMWKKTTKIRWFLIKITVANIYRKMVKCWQYIYWSPTACLATWPGHQIPGKQYYYYATAMFLKVPTHLWYERGTIEINANE